MIPNIEIKPLLSSQGKILSNPDKAQVHFVKTFSDESDFFALVVNVCGEFCDVVPGCFDAMQAGPDDIFIPEEVLGESVMLAIGSMCTVHRTAIGDGFATINDDVYNNIISAMIKYEDGLEELGFDRGYKYLSENDPRIETHHKMFDGFISAQKVFGSEQHGKIYPRFEWFEKASKIQFWKVDIGADDKIKVAAACEDAQSRYYRFEHKGETYELVVSVSKQRGLVDCTVCSREGGLAKELGELAIVFGEYKETVELKKGRCNFPLEFATNGFCLADGFGNEIIMTEH